MLALLWGGILTLAYIGWTCHEPPSWDPGLIDRRWMGAIAAVCFLLTLASGLTMGAGSRMRAPLELIIPLFAGVGLVHVIGIMRTHTHVQREVEAR